MPVAVEGDLVAAADDLARELRPPLHLLADEEERRTRIAPLERVEYGRRPFRMWAVVERQGDCRRTVDPARDAKHSRERGNVSGRRGERPRRRGTGSNDNECPRPANASVPLGRAARSSPPG
jgi:hypothetical protein